MVVTTKVLMIDEDQVGFVTNLTVELVDQAEADEGNLAYHNSETVKNSWETTQELVKRTVAHWGPCRYYIGESDLNVTAPTMEGTDGKSLGIAFYLTSVAAQLGLSLQKGIAITGCVEKTGDFRYPGALEQKVLGLYGARQDGQIKLIVVGPPPHGSADLGAKSQAKYAKILKEFDCSAPDRGHLTLKGTDALWEPVMVQKIFDGSSWYIFLLRNHRIWRSASPKNSTKDLLEKTVSGMRAYYYNNFWSDFEVYVSSNPSAVDTFRLEIPDLALACFAENDSVTLTNLLNAIGQKTSYQGLLESISREDLVAAFKHKLGCAVEDIFQQDYSNCIEAIHRLIKHGKKLTFKLLKDIIDHNFRPFNTAVTSLLELLGTYFKIDPELGKECYRTTGLFKRVEEAAMQLKPSGRDLFQTAIISLVYSESIRRLAQISHTVIDNAEITATADTEVGSEELDSSATLKQLKKIIVKFTKAKTSKSQSNLIERHLRNKLTVQAKSNLSEKLHDRGIVDYQPLTLEVGYLKTGVEVTKADTFPEKKRYCLNEHNRSWKDFDPTEILNPQNVYIISTDAGAGKTTLLWHLQLKIIEQNQFIPIFLHASQLEKLKFKDVSSFLSLFAKTSELDMPRPMQNFLINNFEKVILFIDGLDQIEGVGTDYSDLLDKLLRLFKKNRIRSRFFE